eukprot:gene55581-76164_t
MARIAALRPAGAIIVEEAPTARDALHDHLPITDEGGFYTTPAGGLGYSLPAAVGVARALPDRKLICLLGDGSAMYTSQGLWSAADQGANVSFVILNNGGYAALNNFARRFGLDRLPGTTLEGLDFVALAAAHGVAARPGRPRELTPMAFEIGEDAIAPFGPDLLERGMESLTVIHRPNPRRRYGVNRPLQCACLVAPRFQLVHKIEAADHPDFVNRH